MRNERPGLHEGFIFIAQALIIGWKGMVKRCRRTYFPFICAQMGARVHTRNDGLHMFGDVWSCSRVQKVEWVDRSAYGYTLWRGSGARGKAVRPTFHRPCLRFSTDSSYLDLRPTTSPRWTQLVLLQALRISLFCKAIFGALPVRGSANGEPRQVVTSYLSVCSNKLKTGAANVPTYPWIHDHS